MLFKSYEHFYLLTTNRRTDSQIRLLCSPKGRARLYCRLKGRARLTQCRYSANPRVMRFQPGKGKRYIGKWLLCVYHKHRASLWCIPRVVQVSHSDKSADPRVLQYSADPGVVHFNLMSKPRFVQYSADPRVMQF